MGVGSNAGILQLFEMKFGLLRKEGHSELKLLWGMLMECLGLTYGRLFYLNQNSRSALDKCLTNRHANGEYCPDSGSERHARQNEEGGRHFHR